MTTQQKIYAAVATFLIAVLGALGWHAVDNSGTNVVIGSDLTNTATTTTAVQGGGTSTTIAATTTTTSTPPAASTTTTSTVPPAPHTPFIFDDEFNGSSLDLSRWQPNWLGSSASQITKPINGAETSCYDPAQVSVSGGMLHLNAVARSCKASNGVTYANASGLVETNGRFTFTGGTLTARLCTPPGSGSIANWPAFWADGTGTWPSTGELDVMEGLGGSAAGHFHSPSGGPGVNAPASLAGAGCHVYSAVWVPGKSVTFVYDGTTIGTITSGITSAPMYLILNNGVGGFGGPKLLPADLTVDYVRVSQP